MLGDLAQELTWRGRMLNERYLHHAFTHRLQGSGDLLRLTQKDSAPILHPEWPTYKQGSAKAVTTNLQARSNCFSGSQAAKAATTNAQVHSNRFSGSQAAKAATTNAQAHSNRFSGSQAAKAATTNAQARSNRFSGSSQPAPLPLTNYGRYRKVDGVYMPTPDRRAGFIRRRRQRSWRPLAWSL